MKKHISFAFVTLCVAACGGKGDYCSEEFVEDYNAVSQGILAMQESNNIETLRETVAACQNFLGKHASTTCKAPIAGDKEVTAKSESLQEPCARLNTKLENINK